MGGAGQTTENLSWEQRSAWATSVVSFTEHIHAHSSLETPVALRKARERSSESELSGFSKTQSWRKAQQGRAMEASG